MEGSTSKLSTYRDGYRIMKMIIKFFKNERPLAFFGLIFVLLALLSVGLTIPLIITYLETGLVPRLPTAVLATSIMFIGFLSMTCSLILDMVTHGRREIKRLAYLTVSSTGAKAESEARSRSSFNAFC